MDRRYYFYGRLVTSSDLEALQTAIEEADLRIVAELLDWGMLSGGTFSASLPADWNIIVSAGDGYDDLGQWVGWAVNQTLDCSVDYLGNSTVPAYGYQKNAIYAYFFRGEGDMQMDYFGNAVYFGRPESFVLRVIKGDASPTVSGATVPADPIGNGILLGYFWTRHTSVSIAESDLSESGRDTATTLPIVHAMLVSHIAQDTNSTSVHGAKQGAGNAFDADTVDGMHASELGPGTHATQGTPVHGISRGHFVQGGNFNADKVDGYHASELRGSSGPVTIIYNESTNINVTELHEDLEVLAAEEPVTCKLVTPLLILLPAEDGPAPNEQICSKLLTVYLTTTAAGGATALTGRIDITDISGVVKDSKTFILGPLGIGKQGHRIDDFIVNPNSYDPNEIYSASLSACANAGSVTIHDWVMKEKTLKGTGTGNTGEWRGIWQDTFYASCLENMGNSLQLDLGFQVTGTEDPMEGAKIRVRTYPVGGTPEAGVHIQTSGEQILDNIEAGPTYRTRHIMDLVTSGYTAGEQYWFVLQAYVPDEQEGSLNMTFGRCSLAESLVAHVE